MKREEKAERWKSRDNVVEMEEFEGDTIRDILHSMLVFKSLGANVFVTDFKGTILLEEDLDKEDLPHLDMEPFVIFAGPHFLVPQPVDKEGRRLFFKGTYIPYLLIVPKCKAGLFMGYPILDHPYYVWTEVPDWVLEKMEVASPMVAEVERVGGDMKA